jgi:hypothetical protein
MLILLNLCALLPKWLVVGDIGSRLGVMLLGRIIRAIKKLLFVESPHPASGDRKHFGFYEQGVVRFGYKHMEILLLN